jgi:hypothetical protein
MGELESIITAIAWPVCILVLLIILALIFKKPLTILIGRIRSVEGEGSKWRINMDVTQDTIVNPSMASPSKPVHQYIQVESITSGEAVSVPNVIAGEPKLSDEEIEKSKQKAQQRLDEDTARMGHQRGELYQLKNGSWGIAWGGRYPL